MTKHTPGPWDVERTAKDFRIAHNGDDQRPGYGFIVKTGGVSQIDEANAALIATAPELLEVVDGLVRYTGALDPKFVPPGLKRVTEVARAAIAKAESVQ